MYSGNNNTPSSQAVTRLILETFRFSGRLNEAGDRVAGAFGVSSALWQVLWAVREEPLPVAQIARNIGLARQSVQRTANVLVEREFAAYRNNPDHKRAKLLEMTPAGRDMLAQIMEAQAIWANRLAEGVSAEALGECADLLGRLIERLEQMGM